MKDHLPMKIYSVDVLIQNNGIQYGS